MHLDNKLSDESEKSVGTAFSEEINRIETALVINKNTVSSFSRLPPKYNKHAVNRRQ
ncbi:MAG TPA: hypothetical protein VKY57_10320 [Chitinispirillaceae bacterium]|nr:hypothetical protein [Chitinispirillaceae bacterium]